jgi:RNA polymerase sigma-70 factor (ECF subfamily)
MADDCKETEILLQCRDEAQRQALLAEHFEKERDRLRRMVDLRLDDRLRTRLDPSDVLQEAFIEASRRLGEYLQSLPMPLFLWLRRLTAQKLVDLHRHHLGVKARDPRRETPIGQPPCPAASSSILSAELIALSTPPSEDAIRRETEKQVRDALDNMDPVDREVLALRHFECLTNSEVAAVLGLDISAASKRHGRAIEKLKGILKGLDARG